MRAFEVCVARQGLAQTTLADIAAEAGLPRSLVRYFMGNRDGMVDRLLERLMARAETSLERIRDEAGGAGVSALLDSYFHEVFANDLSNAVMGELWYIAKTDRHVAERLNGVYRYALRLVDDAIAHDLPQSAPDRRRDAAFAVVSLILGRLSLIDFGIDDPAPTALRRAAEQLVRTIVRKEAVT